MIRVTLPFHLRNLAKVQGELQIEVPPPITVASTITAIESKYPMLRGTIRDHGTLKRRPFIRYFACKEDLSLEPSDTPLPEAVVRGDEPFLIIGAMAGGKKGAIIGAIVGGGGAAVYTYGIRDKDRDNWRNRRYLRRRY